MNDENIKDILKIIISLLHNKNCEWQISGSANLKVQGIDISVRDLDITSNEKGIVMCRVALKEYLVKDFFNSKINADSLVCDIHSFEVEINCYRNSKLQMLDKTKMVFWKGLNIPILPLASAKQFYELINRKEKVDIISAHMQD